MSLLLDTCTLFWLSSDQDRLSKTSKEALVEYSGDLFVSAISALECATKVASGKLLLPASPQGANLWFRKVLDQHGITQVPVNFQIAGHAGELPLRHKDPFDRLIVATAWEYRMTVVTPDHMIRQYSEIKCLW